MIKVNVIINNNNWFKEIKNPVIYTKIKIDKINKSDKVFLKKKINFTLLLSGNNEIKNLNKKFRKKNKSTDILSFPFQTRKELNNLLKNPFPFCGHGQKGVLNHEPIDG